MSVRTWHAEDARPQAPARPAPTAASVPRPVAPSARPTVPAPVAPKPAAAAAIPAKPTAPAPSAADAQPPTRSDAEEGFWRARRADGRPVMVELRSGDQLEVRVVGVGRYGLVVEQDGQKRIGLISKHAIDAAWLLPSVPAPGA